MVLFMLFDVNSSEYGIKIYKTSELCIFLDRFFWTYCNDLIVFFVLIIPKASSV